MVKLEVYRDEDEDVRFPGKPKRKPPKFERWSWLEGEDDGEEARRGSGSEPSDQTHHWATTTPSTTTAARTTARIAPVLASHPHLANTPTAPLKAWARRVHAFSESATMLRLQEELGNYKNSKALGALNAARVMVHNVFGFTGRRAEQAKTSMYMYQMTLVHVAGSLRHGRRCSTGDDDDDDDDGSGGSGGGGSGSGEESSSAIIQRVMEDERFHAALITICVELCAFVYRDDDGRFGGGFPVVTNVVEQGGNLPELLVCLDWFAQAFRGSDGPGDRGGGLTTVGMPSALADYVDLISDAVVDRGLFGDCATIGSPPPVMTSPGRPPALVSYCLRSVLFYIHAKAEHVILRAWARHSDACDGTGGSGETDGTDADRAAVIGATRRMVDVLIRERPDVVFGATCSLIAVCCAFCTGKVLGSQVAFKGVCGAAELSPGAARAFYNEVFLPVVYGFEHDRLYGPDE
jgi:hypothetical protein